MIKLNGTVIEPTQYNDGTYNLTILSDLLSTERPNDIIWLFDNNAEMVMLYFVVKHLRNNSYNNINLYLPYVPNARMDRTMYNYEIGTLKYFCEFINSLKFDSVHILDPHSNVAGQLLNNVVIDDVSSIIKKVIKEIPEPVSIVCYPDEGSVKRYDNMIQLPYVFAVKHRDWISHEIKSAELYGDVPQAPYNVLIIDDICGKGDTLRYTASLLLDNGANKVFAYVTHCENTVLKGNLFQNGWIERLYTTDSIYTGHHNQIEVIQKLSEFYGE